MAEQQTICFVVNEASFLISHRLSLVEEAFRRGFQVAVVCGENSGEELLRELDLNFLTIPLTRSGFNPIEEWQTVRALKRAYEQIKPDIVHHITIKPVIYGTQVARWTGVPGVVNAIPGMGFVFTRRGAWARFRRAFVNAMYRITLSHSNMQVIFQNGEDMRGFIDHAIVDREQSHLIRGSGVDIADYPDAPTPALPVRFVLVARMLRHKGVVEYVRAATALKFQHPDWQFLLVGDVDPGNPSSLSPEELKKWNAEGNISWLGHRKDVPDLLRQCHVVCLPSYREGLPKTLLEAAAAGKAIVASDAAGCREVVRDEVTGLIVPARDWEKLRDAMDRVGLDAKLRDRLGRAARDKAEAVFSVEDVVQSTFLVYQKLDRQ